ncbi:11155_t:CDS:1, partial [Scutellospora calospora]
MGYPRVQGGINHPVAQHSIMDFSPYDQHFSKRVRVNDNDFPLSPPLNAVHYDNMTHSPPMCQDNGSDEEHDLLPTPEHSPNHTPGTSPTLGPHVVDHHDIFNNQTNFYKIDNSDWKPQCHSNFTFTIPTPIFPNRISDVFNDLTFSPRARVLPPLQNNNNNVSPVSPTTGPIGINNSCFGIFSNNVNYYG